MGLFDRLFGRQKILPNAEIFQTLTGYQPVFYNWNGMLYESEKIRAAIDARARHISKLKVEFTGAALPNLKTKMKSAPNEFQSWGQFLYRLSTILDMQNTAYILPIIRYGEMLGYYPVLPSSCQIIDSNGTLYLRYQFLNGQVGAVEYSRCGILTKFQYDDDFFGSSNLALKPTMNLITMQNQAINEGIKSSATFRFMATLTNFKNEDDLAKEQANFTKTNLKSDAGGMLLFPNTYKDVKQINSNPFTVDAEQMKLINENIYNYFGVNENILQNKAMGDELDAFFNGAIEPFSIQLSDVMTLMTFTKIERSNGNKVMVTANRLQYMSVDKKIQMAQQMGDRGIMTINEIRELFNYAPLEDGDRATIRGEYYFTDEPRGTEENNGN
jgi:hypothetical protein